MSKKEQKNSFLKEVKKKDNSEIISIKIYIMGESLNVRFWLIIAFFIMNKLNGYSRNKSPDNEITDDH
jgi:hypothetical protein